MRLINVNCSDKESFKYSIVLYLNYYSIKKSHSRKTLTNKNINPNTHIKFNQSNDLVQFEKDNPLIDLLVIDINENPLFLTRNKAKIRITMVKLNYYRYSLTKPSINTFKDNKYEQNKLISDNVNRESSYVLTSDTIYDLKLL